MDHLLRIELAPDGDELSIFGDPEGLRLLAQDLERLAELAEHGRHEHTHLFTEQWGGSELSGASDESDSTRRIIQHLKVYGLPPDNR